jgi:hypothetical protein
MSPTSYQTAPPRNNQANIGQYADQVNQKFKKQADSNFAGRRLGDPANQAPMVSGKIQVHTRSSAEADYRGYTRK